MADPRREIAEQLMDLAAGVSTRGGEWTKAAETLRQAASLLGAREWLDIATAPKRDGHLVLLHPSRGWAEDVNSDCEVGYWDKYAQRWLAYGPIAEDYTGPTHWMPLPPAPPVAAPSPDEP